MVNNLTICTLAKLLYLIVYDLISSGTRCPLADKPQAFLLAIMNLFKFSLNLVGILWLEPAVFSRGVHLPRKEFKPKLDPT